MAARKPLVIVDGQIGQLSASDTLDAAISEVDVTSATNSNAGSVVIGNVMYVDGAGTMDLAQADGAGTVKVLGLVKDSTIATATAGQVQTNGVLVATTGEWDNITGETGGLTPGACYYLSAAAAGDMVLTAPTAVGEFVAPVGLALSTTEFQINKEHTVAL